MTSEQRLIAFGLIMLTLVTIMLSLIFTLPFYDRERRALDAGLQQCQRIGATGTVWQQECIYLEQAK